MHNLRARAVSDSLTGDVGAVGGGGGADDRHSQSGALGRSHRGGWIKVRRRWRGEGEERRGGRAGYHAASSCLTLSHGDDGSD